MDETSSITGGFSKEEVKGNFDLGVEEDDIDALLEKKQAPVDIVKNVLGAEEEFEALSSENIEKSRELAIARINNADLGIKIKPKHREILALHLQGMTGKRIGELVGCSAVTVYNVLKSPEAAAYMKVFAEGFATDMGALRPMVLQALEDGLNSKDLDMRLKTIDRYTKLVAVEKGGGDVNVGDNISVTVINNAREKIIGTISEAMKEINLGIEDFKEVPNG